MSTETDKFLWVIDHQEEVREIIRKNIKKTGYFSVFEIWTPLESDAILKKIESHPPKMIIMDVSFPGIDTIQLIKKLKERTKNIKIILFSQFSDPQKINKAIAAGANFYICKEHMDYNLTSILDMIIKHETTDESLIKKEEELSSILETQQEMLCRFKPDTTLTYVNRAYASMFGKTPEKLIGIKFLSLIPKKDHSFIKRFLKSYTPENHTQTYRHTVNLPDGSVGWQEWTDYAFFDKQGKIAGFQSIGRDITNEVRLTNALTKSEEKERLLISRELHDHIGQLLTYTKLKMEEALAMPKNDAREKVFSDVMENIIETMQEVRLVSRRVAAGYVQQVQFDESLKNLVHSFEQISKIKVKFCYDYIPANLNQSAKNNIYRIIQEGFTNIMKHAEATEVSISLYIRGKMLNLIIFDNGTGIDVDSQKVKDGFITIRHRVNIFGGTIKFRSRVGQFFKIQIQLPVSNIFDDTGEPDGYGVHS